MMEKTLDESINKERMDEERTSDEGVKIPIHDAAKEEAAKEKEGSESSDKAGEIPAEEEEAGQEDKTGPGDQAGERTEEDPDSKGNKKDKKKKKKSAAALEVELKKCKDQVEEYADRYQRLLAEFENARSRSAREQSHMYDAGAKDILAKLLPVVDNFERGLDVLSEEEKEEPFAQGIIKIYQQLMTTLEEVGVKPMNAAGKEFDPNFHNAVMHEDNEEMGENLVAEEFQKGYMYKEDVLRHAMVKVVN